MGSSIASCTVLLKVYLWGSIHSLFLSTKHSGKLSIAIKFKPRAWEVVVRWRMNRGWWAFHHSWVLPRASHPLFFSLWREPQYVLVRFMLWQVCSFRRCTTTGRFVKSKDRTNRHAIWVSLCSALSWNWVALYNAQWKTTLHVRRDARRIHERWRIRGVRCEQESTNDAWGIWGWEYSFNPAFDLT